MLCMYFESEQFMILSSKIYSLIHNIDDPIYFDKIMKILRSGRGSREYNCIRKHLQWTNIELDVPYNSQHIDQYLWSSLTFLMFHPVQEFQKLISCWQTWVVFDTVDHISRKNMKFMKSQSNITWYKSCIRMTVEYSRRGENLFDLIRSSSSFVPDWNLKFWKNIRIWSVVESTYIYFFKLCFSELDGISNNSCFGKQQNHCQFIRHAFLEYISYLWLSYEFLVVFILVRKCVYSQT